MKRPKLARLNKPEILTKLETMSGVPAADVKAVYNALLVLLEDEFKQGHEVIFPGLFKFYPMYRPGREDRLGRNPRTGETLMLPARPPKTVVKFQVLTHLREFAKALDPEQFKPTE